MEKIYNYFMKKYAMSRVGAKDLCKAASVTLLQNLSFFLPIMLSFKFLQDYLEAHYNNVSMDIKDVWFYVGAGILIIGIIYMVSRIQYNATYTKIYNESAKLRIDLAEILRKLPLSFFGKKDIADLSATIMEDATQIETLFSHSIPQLYGAMGTVIVMGIMLIAYEPLLALGILWVVPIALLIYFLSKKGQENIHKKMYAEKRIISDYVQEGMYLAQEIKAYNNEKKYIFRLNNYLDTYEKHLLKGELFIGVMLNLSYMFLHLGMPTTIIFGAYLLDVGRVSAINYIAFLIISGLIYVPFMDVMNNFSVLIFMDVRIKRMREMKKMPLQEGIEDVDIKSYDIEFKNVGFSYEEDVQTLSNISFVAKQGEITALVGPSGGGKSTIAKLAARFWDVDEGTITLGGQDISKIDPETLLKNYSIVFQEVILFNTSILENIRMGNKDASDEDVLKAARDAQCDDFALSLTEGYNTVIGENGQRLSGGERQRISIARAILKDAPVVLLDEATASLDAENESKVQKALSNAVENKTVIVIAHRLRTIEGADKVITVKEGKIIKENSKSLYCL